MPRYMLLIRLDENDVPADRPDDAVMARMGELIEEMTKAGVLLGTDGLAPTGQGTRVHWKGGELSVTDGPFTETKEVVGGYLILSTADQAEAVRWTERFLTLHGPEWTFSCEVREIVTE
ncbi:YciI family protein [Streptomyces uncialis]|uniref:YciI family protein n=1 Tax=Streptomyces uncialis TaxID=1048205 RepID=UPI00382EE6C1